MGGNSWRKAERVQREASRVEQEEVAGRTDTTPERGREQTKGAGENQGVPESPVEGVEGKEGARGTEGPEMSLGLGREGIRDEAASWAGRCCCTEGCT